MRECVPGWTVHVGHLTDLSSSPSCLPQNVAHALLRAVLAVYTGDILYRMYRGHSEHFPAN